MEITRGELINIISAQTQTSAGYVSVADREKEIDDSWIVRIIEVDSDGILNIYCSPPKSDEIE